MPVLRKTRFPDRTKGLEKELKVQGASVVVVGLGRSGLAAALWLAGEGAEVTVSDVRKVSAFDPDILQKARDAGMRLETGGHGKETFQKADWIVISPGVPPEIDPIRSARECGIPVIGEMELACRWLDIPMAGVTGTNGKSTVTALLGDMLRGADRRVFVGGNIGTPLMNLVTGRRDYDCGVVEVSSFQLDTLESFRPEVSVILNISPDHLDRYPDYEAYVQSKLRIFRNQETGQAVILNDDDDRLRQVTPGNALRVLRYGMKKAVGRAAWIEKDCMVTVFPHEEVRHFPLKRFLLPGRHNRENLMAASLAAMTMGAEPEAVQRVIEGFQGLPHRMAWVENVQGVDVYDDSKATNVDAAVRALESFERPVVLIAGGRHKGADYGPLVQAASGRVRFAVLLGEARSLLARSLEGVVPYRLAENMDLAVSEALSLAEPGDALLLAPACSSFDMFVDYAHRGRVFAEAVRRLKDGCETT
jgi:UDP-N-acetylmuramoylalanine--D-glutamate ligase